MNQPLTDEQLAQIEAVVRNAPLIGTDIDPATAAVLLAEVHRLRDHVAELETYALGCDAEGCTTPHSSWCERAKTAAAQNDGCTCPQPWKDSPQPHAGYCWLVSPPRDEIEQARKRIAELGAEHAKLVGWHGEDETAMKRMRATIGRLRAELTTARVQAIRDLADKADPQRPEISFFGDHGHEVGAWMRKQAEYAERAAAPAASAVSSAAEDGDQP